ncbi:MAG: SBBP repeat-containing protein, partial [Candidatus Hodarchaeota archaeon]
MLRKRSQLIILALISIIFLLGLPSAVSVILPTNYDVSSVSDLPAETPPLLPQALAHSLGWGYPASDWIDTPADASLSVAYSSSMQQAADRSFCGLIVENKGQLANREILFYTELGGGLRLGFCQQYLLLLLPPVEPKVLVPRLLRIQFEGAQTICPYAVDEQPTQFNYLLGAKGSYTSLRTFQTILYLQLWPGIDLQFQQTPDGLLPTFQLALGADPAQIRFQVEDQFSNPKASSSTGDGVGSSNLYSLPFLFEVLQVQQQGQDLCTLEVTLVPQDYSSFTLQLPDYKTQQPALLAASPLEYSTFFGGSDSDGGREIALGNSTGEVYLTGNTRSANFPTTPGAYDEVNGGNYDCFVTKLSADGSSLLYSTFVGGSDTDYAYSIAVDNAGNAYVTGWTGSSNFPTTSGAHDESYNGDLSDCFVFKLSADGTSLLNSTFVGGSGIDYGLSLALDSQGNAYVIGETLSSGFPTTSGAYDETFYGGGDCFISKLSADLSSLSNS